MKNKYKKFLLSLIIALLAIFAALSQEFNKLFSVSSSIEFSSNGEKILKAGEISIPRGYMAVNLRFKYYDPLMNKTITKLEYSNILNEKNKPIHGKGDLISIPEGNYKLHIDGSVGTFAVLIYDLKELKEE